MSATNEEREKVIAEWVKRAGDDLETAELILRQTDNYEIAVYHAHQAIEKAIKARLLKEGRTFKFVHDLEALCRQLPDGIIDEKLRDDLAFVNALYPTLRYPGGDLITRDQAEKSVLSAKEIVSRVKAP